MKALQDSWRSDKLKTIIAVFWLLTVFFCFFGSTVLLVNLPGLPALYPFRVLLPVTTLLHLIWNIRKKRNPWKEASFGKRVSYVLCAILLVYSTLSLRSAIDFEFTFTLWITLCFDLVFFAMTLDLCSDRKLFAWTVQCAMVTLMIHMVMGITEIFRGGYFTQRFYEVYFFFAHHYTSPSVSAGNPNDYAMMLVFTLALILLYWAWRKDAAKLNWAPVVLIPVTYFLVAATLGRLCTFSFWLLMVAFAMYTLTSGKLVKRVLIPAALLLGLTIAFVSYGQNYHLIHVPEKRVAAVVEVEIDIPEEATPLSEMQVDKNEFVIVDEESGETRLNLEGSGGVRLALLRHALSCFLQTKGMGVGLGNTAQLAKATAEERGGVWAIHCFLARMTADFGIWFLIPLVLMAWNLLKMGLSCVLQEQKKRNRAGMMTGVLYLTSVVIYPIASTAPGDAQTCLPMWLFLGALVIFPSFVSENGNA